MPDFANGKIYKITCGDETYYGSTAVTLKKRMWGHKGNYKRWKNNKNNDRYACYELFDKYGFDNCEIKLVEEYPCATKKELLIREDWYIKTMDGINEAAAYRTKEEILEYHRQYRQDHKEEINEKQRQYRQDHKKAISEKKRERVVCDCGREVCKNDIAKHRRTERHLAKLNLTL